jgi:hypothetical protein
MSLLLALYSAPALGWTILQNQDGSELRWTRMPIAYSLNPSNGQGMPTSDVTAAVGAALGAWATVDAANIDFSDQGLTAVAAIEYDQINTVYFESDWTLDPELMAITANWSYSDGTIVGFDVRINDRDHQWSTDGRLDAADLQNMLTHEFGHSLGLDHTAVDDSATMFASAIDGEVTKREPKDDDRSAARYLYGEGSPVDDSNDARGGCSTTERHPAGWAIFLLLGVMIRQRSPDPKVVGGLAEPTHSETLRGS